MFTLNRRELLKLASAAALTSAASVEAAPNTPAVITPQWEIFELAIEGPSTGNPFLDVTLTATFSQGNRTVKVDGFYDGNGIYKVRFMPDTLGLWTFNATYNTQIPTPVRNSHAGSLTCTAPLPGSHGPVAVRNMHHFAYADGTPHFPFGTTCYAWVHQPEALQQETLASLKASPFNKIRFCLFPKHYEYNHNEPSLYAFELKSPGLPPTEGNFDFTRPNPAFYAHLEQRIADLRALGIEADLILFHPYDRWGFQKMPSDADDRYLRYTLARLSAYRNVWWSLANEFDLMKFKSTQDFDRFFHIVEEHDPYAHLRSVHYSRVMYDYSRPWVTHASIQTIDFDSAPGWLAQWKKPICYDEVMYEGNLDRRWGNVSGEEEAYRFWRGVIAGCYVTHGETFLDPDGLLDENTTPTLWWSHGGKLHGQSPARIAFLRKLLEETVPNPAAKRTGLDAPTAQYYWNAVALDAAGQNPQQILYYLDFHQPIYYEFPLPEGNWQAEAIDPWAMTITPLPGTHSGKSKVKLPGKPYQALRFKKV